MFFSLILLFWFYLSGVLLGEKKKGPNPYGFVALGVLFRFYPIGLQVATTPNAEYQAVRFDTRLAAAIYECEGVKNCIFCTPASLSCLYLVYLAQSLDCALGKDKAEPSDHATELIT